MLQSLLRKRLDPKSEDWIEQSLRRDGDETEAGALSAGDMEELWNWATPASREFLAKLVEEDSMDDDYTLAEQALGIENVVTGIKRLDDVEDEDDEDGIADGTRLGHEPLGASLVNGLDPAQPTTPLDALLKLTSTGDFNVLPPSRSAKT